MIYSEPNLAENLSDKMIALGPTALQNWKRKTIAKKSTK
jgi:hypothetical protein